MNVKNYFVLLGLTFSVGYSQDSIVTKKWLRTGFLYGISAQNKYLKQDSDYIYESKIYKFSNHFNLSKKRNHSWELFVEPSFYRSEHQLINYWFISHTVVNGDELRAQFMPHKYINEYVLNLGLIYRYNICAKTTLYTLFNVGPMYIDTDTERLRKGFAFSDIFALGGNYRFKKISFDTKCMIRHVSNADTQLPNFGLNAVGFEFGTYYEFN